MLSFNIDNGLGPVRWFGVVDHNDSCNDPEPVGKFIPRIEASAELLFKPLLDICDPITPVLLELFPIPPPILILLFIDDDPPWIDPDHKFAGLPPRNPMSPPTTFDE